MAELTESQQRFLKVWWESKTLQDVVNAYKDDEKFKGKDDKQIASSLKIKANDLRKLDIPMKYHGGRLTTNISKVDKKTAENYLATVLNIPKDELTKARKARSMAVSVTAKKLAGK
jgi:hypothetical protein